LTKQQNPAEHVVQELNSIELAENLNEKVVVRRKEGRKLCFAAQQRSVMKLSSDEWRLALAFPRRHQR